MYLFTTLGVHLEGGHEKTREAAFKLPFFFRLDLSRCYAAPNPSYNWQWRGRGKCTTKYHFRSI